MKWVVEKVTFGDLLALALRRKLLTFVCILLTFAGMYAASSRVEAWNGRVSVVLLLPQSSVDNALAVTSQSLISTTGIVARAVNGPHDPPETVSSDLTLTSLGVERGWSVRQPNSGNQWDTHYTDPVLDVRSSGTTMDEANAQMSLALQHIDDALTALQDARGVPTTARIELHLSPDEPVFLPQHGSRPRAMLAAFLVGALATTFAVLAAEWFVRSRAHGQRPGESAQESAGPGVHFVDA